MAALATNRTLEMTSFALSHNSNLSTKTSSSNGDDSHNQSQSNGQADKTSKTTSSDDSTTTGMHMKMESLPPEKQLSKLKRFLQTIHRTFAESETPQRDRVKRLMVDLINADVSAQEFYVEMKGSTKFPLRPYVVPFLEASLPLIRTSLNLPVKVERLETELGLPSPALGSILSVTLKKNSIERLATSQNGLERKRRATEASPESSDSPSPKRSHFHGTSSSKSNPYPDLFASTSLVNGNGCSNLRGLFPNTLIPTPSAINATANAKLANGNGTTAPAMSVSTSSASNGLIGLNVASSIGQRPADLASAFQEASNGNQPGLDRWTYQTDEWRNIENLFTTMATTMERLRCALILFQHRARLTQLWNEKFQQHQRLHDSNMKIEEMQRRADTAVQEVKRAAVSELQKAVHAAEQKALQMIANERSQMEKLIRDTQIQEENTESCRNCGRRAGQTCSGCGKARYCGVFCQHKDWPRHRTCCLGVNDPESFNGVARPRSRHCNETGSTEETQSRSPPTSSITCKTHFSTFISSSKKKDRISPKSI